MTGLRKRYLFLATAIMLTAVMVGPGTAFAGARIQDEGRGTVSLDRVGDAPEQATGTARFRLRTTGDGWYRMEMRLRVRNLPERAGQVYETWLRDSNTNHDDSVGAFQTDNNGDGRFDVGKRIVFFAPYDKIVVSSERRNDSDPSLNGPVLLEGDLE